MENRPTRRDARTPSHERRIDRRHLQPGSAHDALRLLPVWPKALSNRTPEGRRNLIAIIERELRKERRRGIAGDRAYDLARHVKLVHLLRQERHSLLTIIGQRTEADGTRRAEHPARD
jgi:hypothetical protein